MVYCNPDAVVTQINCWHLLDDSDVKAHYKNIQKVSLNRQRYDGVNEFADLTLRGAPNFMTIEECD
jgi:hypothetical protein